MIDRYTRTVLTIIAVALVGLLAVQLTPVARAQGMGCGEPANPCYVSIANSPIHVFVDNQPIG